MLMRSRVASRTLGLHGPDMARGQEAARFCSTKMSRIRMELLTMFSILSGRPETF